MKKIDMHTHMTLFPDIVPDRGGNGERFLCDTEMLEIHDKLNVEYGVILPLIAPEAQWMIMTNEEAKTLADRYPDRYVWFCNVDPRAGTYSKDANLRCIIRHYKSLGARGLGELTTTLDADDPMMDNLFTACEEEDMPVLIHIAPQHGHAYGIVDEPGLPRIEKMLKKHPKLKLIGHSAAFWGEIGTNIDLSNRDGYPTGKVEEGRLPYLMRTCPNLYCDLSAGSGSNAMMRDPEYAAKFLAEFSDRIFYGADVCSTSNTFQYDFDAFLTKMVEDKTLSVENYEKIIRKNAEKLLGL